MKRIFVFIFLCLISIGCDECDSRSNPKEPKLIMEKDDVKIYRFYDSVNTRAIYFTNKGEIATQ